VANLSAWRHVRVQGWCLPIRLAASFELRQARHAKLRGQEPDWFVYATTQWTLLAIKCKSFCTFLNLKQVMVHVVAPRTRPAQGPHHYQPDSPGHKYQTQQL
jgi:hypothetical protein